VADGSVSIFGLSVSGLVLTTVVADAPPAEGLTVITKEAGAVAVAGTGVSVMENAAPGAKAAVFWLWAFSSCATLALLPIQYEPIQVVWVIIEA
jgi:hypothetical protein